MTKEQKDALSPEARALYRRVIREWSISDGCGEALLLVACQSLDRLRQAQALMAVEGIVTKDRFGQTKAHPASAIERESRAGLLAALKSLNLDLDSLEQDA